MLIFILRRLGTMVLTMVVVSILLFLLLEIDKKSVATKVLGPYSSNEQRELWLEANGYNEPLPVRYGNWAIKAVVGDFGDSVRFKVPVGQILWPRLGNTGVLALATLAVVIPLSPRPNRQSAVHRSRRRLGKRDLLGIDICRASSDSRRRVRGRGSRARTDASHPRGDRLPGQRPR